jgi:hypothetical protein
MIVVWARTLDWGFRIRRGVHGHGDERSLVLLFRRNGLHIVVRMCTRDGYVSLEVRCSGLISQVVIRRLSIGHGRILEKERL